MHHTSGSEGGSGFARAVAISGLAALALAMGIGRFAFTPILPMMQEDWGLTVSRGSWLASANYFGYLLGALSAMRIRLAPGAAIRVGLVLICATTVGMAFLHTFAEWFALRLVAGIASAWVLVFVSAWTLEQLSAVGKSALGGIVYGGVGVGIFVTGSACLVLLNTSSTSDTAWFALGLLSIFCTVLLWNRFNDTVRKGNEIEATQSTPETKPIVAFSNLVICYGAFGFGYIVPATFLPMMAKDAIPDPNVFGWAWPAFGAAAFASTLLASRLSRRVGQRAVWIGANILMAVGLPLPVLTPSLAGMLLAALCVGGTFMVITMVGLQEARRLAGPAARTLIAAMTAAFAVGQILGPLLAGYFVKGKSDFSFALWSAALVLLLSAIALYRGRAEQAWVPQAESTTR